ncbi:MAG: TonB-dependent receptor [Alphaproteobacteria bacterium]|nr:TonB-dependent receptor [Alphaproteobacteria bacterium]
MAPAARIPVLLLLLAAGGAARAEGGAGEEGAPDEGGAAGEEAAEELPAGEEMLVAEEAAPEGPDPGRVSSAVTVIAVDEALPASDDVASVVETAAGTTVTRLGGLGDWAGVSIRGAQVRHTEVVLDGIPLNPDGSGAVNLSELPLWAFDRVEIYRGAPPPALASSPLGGVIHLVTADAAEARQSVAASYGSHWTNRVVAAARVPETLGSLDADTFAVAEVLSTRGDYSFFSDNGTEYNLLDDGFATRENNDKLQLSAHLRQTVGGPRWRLSVLDAFLDREEGLAGHANSPTRQVRLWTLRNLAAARLSGERGDLAGELRLWGLLRREDLDDRAGEIGVGSQHSRDASSAVGVLASGRAAVAPGVVPGLTLSLRRDGYRPIDLRNDRPGTLRTRVALSGAASGDLYFLSERVLLSPALLATGLFSQTDGASVQTLLLSPRVGLLLRPLPSLALKANAGIGQRAPDFSELFGDRGAVVGNPDLRPERGRMLDLALRLAPPERGGVQGVLEAGAFANRMTDQIVYVQNAQRTMVPLNLDDSRTRGLELALALDLWARIESRSALTRSWSENLSTDPAEAGNQLPRIPAWELSQRTAVLHGERWRIGHDYSFTDGNFWDRTNFYRAAPRHLHGLFARVGSDAGLSAELSVRNLFDRVVQVVPRNPLDPDETDLVVQPLTDFVGYPLPGRTVLFTLRWAPSPGAS